MITLGHIQRVDNSDNGIEVMCEHGKMRITVIEPRVVRIQLTNGDQYRNHDSFARVPYQKSGSVSIQQMEEQWQITAGWFTIDMAHDTRLTVFDKERRVLCRQTRPVSWTERAFRVEFQMEGDEHFYGLGEKAHGLDKRGRHYEMWNTSDPNYTSDSDPLYQSIPFFITLRGGNAHGIFLDNTYKTFFDLGKESESVYYFGAVDGPVDFYILHGPRITDVIDKYTAITGKPYFLPRWALGHQHSRWMVYESQENVLRWSEEFRSRRIPCDTLVLDIDYMDEYRIFTWNPEVFPDPRTFTDRLKEKHFRIMTIIDPGVKLDESFDLYREGAQNEYFLKRDDGSIYIGLVWPGETVFPDFTKAEVRKWFGSKYIGFAKSGVSNSSWLDMNEPSHCIYEGLMEEYSMEQVVDDQGNPWEPRLRNVYGMCMAQAAFEGLKSAHPGERPFLLTRSGFAGYQRYSATWTGDNQSDWEHLWLSIPIILGLGLSGVPVAGADIGGFSGDVTPELLVRWYQLGVFYPFSRNHSRINTTRQEPWLFGGEIEDIIRRFLTIRYQIMRYLYSLLYEASKTGVPIMRPLVLEYQDDPNTYLIDDQFLVGPFLLVAPILAPGATERKVYLPEGIWVDFWNGEGMVGPAVITREAPLNKTPIFLRGGSIIPTGRPVQHTDEDQGDLVLWVIPHGTGEFRLYEDDGVSEDGQYAITWFNVRRDKGRVVFTIEKREGALPIERDLVIQFWTIREPPHEIHIDSKPLELTSEQANFSKEERKLSIVLNDDGGPHTVIVLLDED